MTTQTPEAVATLAAGFVAPFVTGIVQRFLWEAEGLAAVGLTLAVSAGLAVAAMGMTHTLGADWWSNILAALGIATVTYRTFEEKLRALRGKKEGPSADHD